MYILAPQTKTKNMLRDYSSYLQQIHHDEQQDPETCSTCSECDTEHGDDWEYVKRYTDQDGEEYDVCDCCFDEWFTTQKECAENEGETFEIVKVMLLADNEPVLDLTNQLKVA